jgi:hypothetical protein
MKFRVMEVSIQNFNEICSFSLCLLFNDAVSIEII